MATTGENGSITPLGAGETYTGPSEYNREPDVMVSCFTDADCTLYFDFSVDGTNFTTFPVNGFKVQAGVHEFHTAVKGPRVFRVRLVNGAVAQTELRLYTYYGDFRHGNSPLNQRAGLDQDAQFVRGSIPEDEIRIGLRAGVTGWNKFGYNADVSSAAPEVVATFGGTFTPLDSAETFTIAYNNATDGLGTTGATELTFSYVDAAGFPATATHTLGSTGSDVTAFTGLGINRVAVSASGSANVNTNNITITATTAGTNQAQVPAGDGVTEQAIFHVGSNHLAVAKNLFVNIRKLSGGTAPRVTIRALVYNRNIATTFNIFRFDIDTAIENTLVYTDPVGFTLNPTDVLYFTAETNTNATIVNCRFSLVEYQRT